MSIPLFSVTEGWTQELGPFTLRINQVPLSLSGFTVVLTLRDSIGEEITPGGNVRVATDQVVNAGQVYYTPVAADFVWNEDAGTGILPQDFRMHWKVTDGLGKIVFFPNGVADVIAVNRK